MAKMEANTRLPAIPKQEMWSAVEEWYPNFSIGAVAFKSASEMAHLVPAAEITSVQENGLNFPKAFRQEEEH